ncbi:MAG: ATPase domain-containing protein [Thermoplasmata archaeon]
MENDPRPAPALERISTGVPELDEMLAGGLLPHRPYLLVGPPGSGKTTLALQFLIEGVRRGEEVLYVTLEEPPNEVRQDHQAMGPEFEQIYVFDAVPDVMRYERTPFKDIASVREAVRISQIPLSMRQTPEFESVDVTMTSLQPTIRQEVRRRHYKRLVIDSLTALQFFCMPGVSETQGAQTFLRFLSDLGTTTVLTLEVPGAEEESEEHLLARGELRLFRWEAEGRSQYAIGVEKFRGSSHDIHLHPYRISPHGLDINLSVTIPAGGVAAPAQTDATEVLGVPPEEVAYEIRRSVLNLDQDIRDLLEVGVDVKPMHEGVRFVLTALADHRYGEALIRLRETRAQADRLIDAYHLSVATEQPKPPVVVPIVTPWTVPSAAPPPGPEVPPAPAEIPPPPQPIAEPAMPPAPAPEPPALPTVPVQAIPEVRPPEPIVVTPLPPPPMTPPPPPIPPPGPPTIVAPEPPVPEPQTAAPPVPVVPTPISPVPVAPVQAPLLSTSEPASPTLVHRFFRRAPKPSSLMPHPTARVRRVDPTERSSSVDPTVPPAAPEKLSETPLTPVTPKPATTPTPSPAPHPARVPRSEPVPPLRPPPPATVSPPVASTTVPAGAAAEISGSPPISRPPMAPSTPTPTPVVTPIPPGVIAEPVVGTGVESLPLPPPAPLLPKAKRRSTLGSARKRKAKPIEPVPQTPPIANVIVTPPPEPEPLVVAAVPPRRPPRRRRKAPLVTGAEPGPMTPEGPRTESPTTEPGTAPAPSDVSPSEPPAEN